jgi:hypothetical protein
MDKIEVTFSRSVETTPKYLLMFPNELQDPRIYFTL